jgi:hypothetical protein
MISLKLGREHFREMMADFYGDVACNFLYDYYLKGSGYGWEPPEEVQIIVDPEMIRQKWIEYKSFGEARRDLGEEFKYYLINGVILVNYEES